MADEEVEDGNDREPISPTGSKKASLEEYRSKSSSIEGVLEETDDKIENEATLNGEDAKSGNGEIDKEERGSEGNGKTIASFEKIERLSKDSRDASLEKESTSASKLTDVDDDEGGQASMMKKPEKQQVQKGKRLRCGRQFREIIGKQELRREELEKREGDLRQRLDVLECSMPAVMVWNVWQRMAQGGPVPNLHRLMEKQFRAPAAGEICCPSTPSQHYDCRVREVEAERKEARRRLEEAKELWLDKEARLRERREKLEVAKKLQEERKEKIERLTKETNELKEVLRKMDEETTSDEERTMSGACESGECGDMRCREGWLRRVGSVDSIKSMDVECLARLRELAESELTMKKQIAELERREETYMRTLQHADEMWSKMEGDTADSLSSLQDQLDTKINANQQLASRICELEDELEKLRERMALCRSELTKYMSVGKIETTIGREDDFAETTDKMVGIEPRVVGKVVGREDDLAEVHDKEILTKDELEDKETLARVDVEDKEVSPDRIMLDIGEPPTKEPMEQEKIDEMHKYLAMLGSLEELYYDDDYGICGPESPCNEEDWFETDEDFSTTDIRSTPVISEKVLSVSRGDARAEVSRDIDERDTLPITKRAEEIVQSGELEVIPEAGLRVTSKFNENLIEEKEGSEEVKISEDDYEEVKEPKDDAPVQDATDKDNVTVPLSKLRSWVDTIDSIRSVISKCSTCSSIKDDADTLAEEVATYAGVKAKEVIAEVIPGLAVIETDDEEEAVEKVAGDSEMIDEGEAIPKFVTEVEDEFQTTAEVEPAAEPSMEPIVEPDVEPIIEPAVEPAVEPTIGSPVEPAVEPAVEPSIASPAEPIVEPTVEPAVEPTIESPVERIVEPAVERAVAPKTEPVTLVPDEVAAEEAAPERKEPEKVFEEQKLETKEMITDTDIPVDVPDKEIKLESIDEEKIEKDTILEKDIVTDEETKIILPIQKLTDEEELSLVEKEAPPSDLPVTEGQIEVEETRIDDSPLLDEDAIEERIEPEGGVEKIEVEKVLSIETGEALRDTREDLIKKPITMDETTEEEKIGDVPTKKDIPEELESELVPQLETEVTSMVSAEKPTEKIEAVEAPSAEEIFVDAEAEEPSVAAVPTKEISETIEFKEEIPMEKDAELIEPPERVSIEEKAEEVEEKVPLVEEKSIEIEEVGEIKEEVLMEKEMPILEEPEIEDIKETVEEIVEIEAEELGVKESPVLSFEEKPEIKKKPRIPIDPKIVPTPYLAVADIEEMKEEPRDAKELPCVCRHLADATHPPTLPPMQIVITQTETVQTIVNRGTQTWTVHLTPIKGPGQRSIEADTRDSEIATRKMRWQMRPKNRPAKPSSNVSSQTEKPLVVLRSTTHDPCPSENQRLLSNILKSLKPSQSTLEKEIRTISYGQKHNETNKCDCCVCGKEKFPRRAPPMETGPVPLAKLPRVKLPRMEQITRDWKPNYETAKSVVTEKQQTSPSSTASVTKSVKQVCDRGICTCAPSSLKSKPPTSPRKIIRSEKRDQSCLAKLPKSKMRSTERRKDEKLGVSPCGNKCTKEGTTTGGIVQETKVAADSPSNCMCTKMEKTPSGHLRKRQICACGDSD